MNNQDIQQNEKKERNSYSFFGSGAFVGSCLVVLGFYFLGKELGWFDYDFPFWAVILILAGVWMIFGDRKKC